MPRIHKLQDLGEYQEIPKEALVAADAIVDRWEKLGKPSTPFTKSGKEMVNFLIKVWEITHPIDYQTFLAERNDYQKSEKTLSEQVSQRTGRSLASYPMPIYRMMKKVFKGFDPAERKNCIKMVKIWPMFRMANRV